MSDDLYEEIIESGPIRRSANTGCVGRAPTAQDEADEKVQAKPLSDVVQDELEMARKGIHPHVSKPSESSPLADAFNAVEAYTTTAVHVNHTRQQEMLTRTDMLPDQNAIMVATDVDYYDDDKTWMYKSKTIPGLWVGSWMLHFVCMLLCDVSPYCICSVSAMVLALTGAPMPANGDKATIKTQLTMALNARMDDVLAFLISEIGVRLPAPARNWFKLQFAQFTAKMIRRLEEGGALDVLPDIAASQLNYYSSYPDGPTISDTILLRLLRTEFMLGVPVLCAHWVGIWAFSAITQGVYSMLYKKFTAAFMVKTVEAELYSQGIWAAFHETKEEHRKKRREALTMLKMQATAFFIAFAKYVLEGVRTGPQLESFKQALTLYRKTLVELYKCVRPTLFHGRGATPSKDRKWFDELSEGFIANPRDKDDMICRWLVTVIEQHGKNYCETKPKPRALVDKNHVPWFHSEEW